MDSSLIFLTVAIAYIYRYQRRPAWLMVSPRTLASRLQSLLYQRIYLVHRSVISCAIGRLLFWKGCFECDVCCLTLGGHDLEDRACSCAGQTTCRLCWKRYLETQIMDDAKSQLVCLNHSCVLDDRWVRNRLSSQSMKRLDLQQILAVSPNASHKESIWTCPSPDCEYVGFVDARIRRSPGWLPSLFKKTSADPRRIDCPLCQISSCVYCKLPWTHGTAQHNHVSCESYRSKRRDLDTHYRMWKKQSNVRSCPGCGHDIEKRAGCIHMTCRCGHEFCFVCLTPWSSQHSYYCRGNKRSMVQRLTAWMGAPPQS